MYFLFLFTPLVEEMARQHPKYCGGIRRYWQQVVLLSMQMVNVGESPLGTIKISEEDRAALS